MSTNTLLVAVLYFFFHVVLTYLDMEKEVNLGIMASPNPSKECACFVRNFQIDDISMTSTDDKSIQTYFDVGKDGMPCAKTKERLNDMCFEKLKEKLSRLNFNAFKVKWLQGGINPKFQAHKEYLKLFGENFKATLLDLIHEYVDTSQNEKVTNLKVLFNLRKQQQDIVWQNECELFSNRKELLTSLIALMSECFEGNSQQKNPLLIHGSSGNGKTSLLSMLVKNGVEWTGVSDLVTVARFLETSCTCKLQSFLRSLCYEIQLVFQFDDISINLNTLDLNALKVHFSKLISCVGLQSKCLLIVIDAIDQLSSSGDNKQLVNWLPKQLPHKVMIVLSTESNKKYVLRNFKSHINSKWRTQTSPPVSMEVISSSIEKPSLITDRSEGAANVTDDQPNSITNDSLKRRKRSRRNSSKVSPRPTTLTEADEKSNQKKSSMISNNNNNSNKVVGNIQIQGVTPRNERFTDNNETDGGGGLQIPGNQDRLHPTKDSTFVREATFQETVLEGREQSSVEHCSVSVGEMTTDSSETLLHVNDTLTHEDRNAIITHSFTQAVRCVTQSQSDYVKSCVEICSQPLYVKLVIDEALSWSSYDHSSTLNLPLTASEMIAYIFQRLEETYGTILVSHALAYLTSADGGLSECELLDILSLDNMALNDVFENTFPIVRDVIRFPSLLWKRVRHALDKYLVECDFEGVCLLNWCHRLFWEVANQRYLRNEEKIKYINKILCEYFLGNYSKTTKLVTLQKLDGKQVNAQRHVAPQPLEHQKGQYNRRKLSQLPTCLIKCKNEKILFKQVFFNFEWIRAKIQVDSLQELLHDLQEYLLDDNHKEVQLLYDTLRLCAFEILQNSTCVANQLLGRLSHIDAKHKPNISRLLEGVREYLRNTNQPVLCLQNRCFLSPSERLEYTTHLPSEVFSMQCVKTNDGKDELCICCSKQQNIIYVNFLAINSGDIISSVILDTECKTPVILNSSAANRLYVGHTRLDVIEVNSIKKVKSLENDQVNITSIAENTTGSIVCVAYTNGVLRFYDVMNWDTLADIGIGSSSTIFHVLFSGTSSHNVMVGPSINSSWLFVDHKNLLVERLAPSIAGSVKSTSKVLKMVEHDAVVVSFDNIIHVWNNESREYLHTFTGHLDEIECLVKVNADIFASGGNDSVVKVWYLSKKLLLHTLRGHSAPICCISFCSDLNALVTGSKDCTVKKWNFDEFKCRETLADHVSSIKHVSLTSSRLISISQDSVVKVWDDACPSGDIPSLMDDLRHTKPCCSVGFSYKFNTAFTLSEGEKIILWDVQTKAALWQYKGNVSAACFSLCNLVCYVATLEGEVLAFLTVERELTKASFTHQAVTGKISFVKHLGGDILLLCTYKGEVLTFDCNEKVSKLLFTHENPISCVQIKDGIIAVGSDDCNLSVYTYGGELNISQKQTLKNSKKPITCVAILKSSDTIVSCDSIGTLCSWSLETGDLKSTYSCSLKIVNCIVGNEHSGSVITGSKDTAKLLTEWDLTSSELLTSFNAHKNSVLCLRITDDMKYLLSGAQDGTFVVWDANTKSLIDSITFNSVITSFDVSKLIEKWLYKIVVVMKSGNVAFVDFQVTSQLTRERSLNNRGHIIMLNHIDYTTGSSNDKNSDNEKENEKSNRCCLIL